MSNVFEYAAFYFGNTSFLRVAEKYGEEYAANMAAIFHEVQILPGSGSFQDSVESAARRLAELSGLEDVTIKMPGAMYVAIYEKDRCLGFVDIDVFPGDRSAVMANGDTAGNLYTYGWKAIRKLERAAA